jgi:hypothetical protein
MSDIIISPTFADAIVAQMFDAALGHLPTWATLTGMMSSGLSDVQLAEAIVSSQAFAETNNGGALVDPNASAAPGIIDHLFMTTLGHLPTASTLAGFEGMTNEQAFYAFATSDTVSNAIGAAASNFVAANYDSAASIVSSTPGLTLLGISPDNVHFA